MSAQNHPLGDGVLATDVERPASVDELRDVVRRRAGSGEALYPQGGGTALDYGGVPRRPGAALSTRGLARVVDYPAADMTITVEAGTTIGELARTLDAEGQRLTLDPPNADRATLGGVFATNASGPRRYGLGRPRDQIIGVSFVASDGEVVKGGGRVVKNVAGYDFPRLVVGSMGTLGVLVQMTLKVRPKPEASALLWVSIESDADLAATLDRINLSAARPTAVELYNRPAAETVGGGSLPAANWTLAVGFEDNAASVRWQVERFRSEMGSLPAAAVEGDDAAGLWSRMVDHPDAAEGTLAFEAHLPPSKTAGFAATVDPGRWSLQAHAGSGVVRGYAREPLEAAAAASAVAALRAEAGRCKGSLTLPRCPTQWKAELKVWGEPRPEWAWCERLKTTLDPAGAFNPGRFVGSI